MQCCSTVRVRPMKYAFQTVDVFTDRKFGGNPLAVLTDARELSTGQMQAIAAEFNYAETTFVLPSITSSTASRSRRPSSVSGSQRSVAPVLRHASCQGTRLA